MNSSRITYRLGCIACTASPRSHTLGCPTSLLRPSRARACSRHCFGSFLLERRAMTDISLVCLSSAPKASILWLESRRQAIHGLCRQNGSKRAHLLFRCPVADSIQAGLATVRYLRRVLVRNHALGYIESPVKRGLGFVISNSGIRHVLTGW